MCVKLNHPGIVRVYDLVEEQGTLAMIMEYIKEDRCRIDRIGGGADSLAKSKDLF